MHFLATRRTDMNGASNSSGLRTAAALVANARPPATQPAGDGFGRVSDPLPPIEAPLNLQPPPVKNNNSSNGNSKADWLTGWIPLALQGQLRRKRQKHQFDDAEEEQQQGPQKKKHKKRRIIFLDNEVKREAKKEEPDEDISSNNQDNGGNDDHDNCQQQSLQGSKQPSPIIDATDVVTPVTESEASSSQNSTANSSESDNDDDNASLSLTPTDPIDKMALRLSKTVVIGKPRKNRWHPDSQFADPVHEIVEEDELSVGSGVGARDNKNRGSPMTVPLVVTEWLSQKRAPVEALGVGGDFLEAQKGFDVDDIIGTAKQRKVTGFSQIMNGTTSQTTQLQQQKDQATLSTADTQTEEATIAATPLPTEKAAEVHAQNNDKDHQSTAPLSAAIDARAEAGGTLSPLQTDNESEVQTNPSLQEEQASSSTSDAPLQKSPASPKTGTKATNDSNELSEEAGTPSVETESDSQVLQEEKGRLSEAKGKLQQMKLKLQLIQGNNVRSTDEGNDDIANQSARKVNGNVPRNDTEEPMQFDMPDYDSQEGEGKTPAKSSAPASRDNATASRAVEQNEADEDQKPRAETRKSTASDESRPEGERNNREDVRLPNPEEVLEIDDSDDETEVQPPPPPPQQPNGQNEIVEIDDSDDESEVQAPLAPQQPHMQNGIVEIDDSDDETEAETEVQPHPLPQQPHRQNEIVEIADSDDDETETDNGQSVPESPQASSRVPNRPERAAASDVVMADRQRAGRRSRRETSVRQSAQETGPANRRRRRTLQTSPTHSTQSAPDDNQQSQPSLEGSNLNRSAPRAEETSTGKRPRRKTLQRSANNLAPAGKKQKAGDEHVPGFDGARDGNTENLEEASVDELASSTNKRLRPPRVSQSPESNTSESEGSTAAFDRDQGAPVPSINLPASLSLPRRVSRSPAKAVTESSSFSDSSTSNETLADIEAAETESFENDSIRDESTVGEQEESTDTGSSSDCAYPADNPIGKCERICKCSEMKAELSKFQAANQVSCQSPYSLKKFRWLWDEVQRKGRELGTTSKEIEKQPSFSGANYRVPRNVGGNQGKAQYGRILPGALQAIFKEIMKLNSDHVFVDLGHGIGNTSMQAAFTFGCKSKGVELIKARHLASEAFHRTVVKLANQKRATKPENWDHKAGLIELKQGSILDPDLHEWLTSDVDRVFVNNYEEVMASRSEPRGTSCHVDAKIAALFANMKPGAVMVTLEHIHALGKAKEEIEEQRKKQGYDTHGGENHASFYEWTTHELGPTNECVSWSDAGGKLAPLKIYKYTRLEQAGVANGSVRLCTTKGCEWARNATPIPATTVGRDGVEINLNGCGGCDWSARNTRGKKKCKSPEKLKGFVTHENKPFTRSTE